MELSDVAARLTLSDRGNCDINAVAGDVVTVADVAVADVAEVEFAVVDSIADAAVADVAEVEFAVAEVEFAVVGSIADAAVAGVALPKPVKRVGTLRTLTRSHIKLGITGN